MFWSCIFMCFFLLFVFFFFNDTATTEIYTLSLHDALPIGGTRMATWKRPSTSSRLSRSTCTGFRSAKIGRAPRLNSSHGYISYAVFCLKKKNQNPSLHFSNKKKNKKKSQT